MSDTICCEVCGVPGGPLCDQHAMAEVIHHQWDARAKTAAFEIGAAVVQPTKQSLRVSVADHMAKLRGRR